MNGPRPCTLVTALLLVWLAAASAPRAQKPAIFESNVDAVRIDVMASDHNKPITGLTANDFDITDNGVPQKVDLATDARSVSLAIALDVQEDSGWGELAAASRQLADAIRPFDRAWLMTFSEVFDLRAGPTSDPLEIRRALEDPPVSFGKSLWDAVFAAVALVSGRDGRALVVVASDGQQAFSHHGFLSEDRAIEALKRGEVAVCAIQARLTVSAPTALERAAKATGGVVFEAARQSHLAAQLTKLLDDYRQSYVLTFTPTGVKRDDGWHKLSVKLKNHSGKTVARDGYYAATK